MVQTIIRNFVMAALTVSDSGCSVAQERAAQPGKKVILHVARLLDVKTGTILSDQVIVIEGGEIATIGPAKSVKATGDGQLIEILKPS